MRVPMQLFMLPSFQLLSHSALDLRNVDQLWLKVFKYVVFLTNDFWAINIVPFKSCEQSLCQLCLVNSLIGRQLEVWILLCHCAQTHLLDHFSSSL